MKKPNVTIAEEAARIDADELTNFVSDLSVSELFRFGDFWMFIFIKYQLF
ncbi:hypothetical protein HanPI659440_Chr04g0176261 [Helianthus annuus]|nr:hypothetical protein HanPI659440_Chr04g0176261 [Helianthus annuus]